MDEIIITGAKTHNLKNVTVKIPRGKLTVITGLSGSGKSSLAYDTLYAEGQRRYVESLSSYARQFLQLMPHPDVESVQGLSPAIAIDQHGAVSNPRSTVGTATEIADYLRLLFARAGVPYCPEHQQPLSMQSVASMVDETLAKMNGERIMIIAPGKQPFSGDYTGYFQRNLALGYRRYRIDGEVEVLDEPVTLDDGKAHVVDVVIDRLRVSPESRTRLAESFQMASELSGARVIVITMDGSKQALFSTKFACPHCNYTVPLLEPAFFSFNNPRGWCCNCRGSGTDTAFDLKKIVAFPEMSIQGGAIPGWDIRNSRNFELIGKVAESQGISLQVPWNKLTPEQQAIVLYGNKDTQNMVPPFVGVFNSMTAIWEDEGILKNVRETLNRFRSDIVCPVCNGRRLRREVLSVYLGDGHERYAIDELERKPLSELHELMKRLVFDEKHERVARRLLEMISTRLSFLEDVGLGYLTLSRQMITISGGEAQRIRLAGQIGSGLTGVLYVLDEPSIGLHQRDNERLLKSLLALRDLGNTLVMVEHDEDTIRNADYVIDMGPGAGENGGEVCACGTPEEIILSRDSLTGRYLSGELRVPCPECRRKPENGWLVLKGAVGHNLKSVNLEIPVGLLTVVSGVSGSGKSSLILKTLYPAMAALTNRSKVPALPYGALENYEKFSKVVVVDQSPIGKTPRSNPATYTGMFTAIREIFGETQMARERGYSSSRFSFNVKGGRCETCQGDGAVRMQMHFLPDIFVPCEACGGKRYNRETLEVKFKGYDISEILEMTVDSAIPIFEAHPKITRILKSLSSVGLGYIRLGQSATTFSGGEAQRIKLAGELARPESGDTLYILDEPTTGLHFHDIAQLMDVFSQLTDVGNTVVVIEHNLDVIKGADWLIDMGPESGEQGGEILFAGIPSDLIDCERSRTAPFLRRILNTKTVKK